MADSKFSQLYPTHNVYDYRANYDPSQVGNYGGGYEKSWYEKAGGDWLGSAALGAAFSTMLPGLGSLPQILNDNTLKAVGLGGISGLFNGEDIVPWHETHTPYGPYPVWGDPLSSFSGFETQVGGDAPAGAYSFSSIPWETGADLSKDYSLELEGMPGASGKSYRTIRNWSDWWRTAVGQSLGTQGQAPLDPLSQLQGQLVGQADPNASSGGLSAQGQAQSYQNAQADALRQRAAGMGLQGIYDPAISQQQRTIDTVASQAEAAYRPLAWQQKQQYETQMQQLLQTIQQSEYMRDLATASAGR